MSKTNGFRVAKPGRKAASSNPDDLSYTSENISPKIFLSGIGTLTTNNDGKAKIDIFHGLGYSPQVLGYYTPTISIANDSFPMPNSWGLIDNTFIRIFSNQQTVTIEIIFGFSQRLYKYKYFIFADPLV